MAIKLHRSRILGATPALLIKENIEIGKRIVDVYKEAKFYRKLKTQEAIATIIRNCNGTLGASGNFKNGCLYRQKGLQEFWKSKSGEKVVCDHAIPVSELVRMHVEEGELIERLIFSPVVRISLEANDKLTRSGYAKSGFKTGFPLFRYSHINIEIVTHNGASVDPAIWTDKDHMTLVRSTSELAPILKSLNIKG